MSLILIIALGVYLRNFNYAQVPKPGEVADEYSFAWVGLSLIEEHYPIGWSGISGYKQTDYQKIDVDHLFTNDKLLPPFPINKPWFDHPPLFGLITGGFAYFKGVRSFDQASVVYLRKPMLLIGIITTLLIFYLALRLFQSKSIALLSALLYSVIPTTVLSSRLALSENGYIPLFLGALILSDYYFVSKKFKYWVFALILASFAILFKLSALSIALTLFFEVLVFAKKDKKKLNISLSLAVLIPLFAFVLYGAYYDFQTFVNVFLANGSRLYGAGSESFLSAIIHPLVTLSNIFVTDGWIPLGFICLFMLMYSNSSKEKGITVLALSFFSYFIFFLIFGSESYGWYRYPFYPFLIISISLVFQKLIKQVNIMLFVPLALLPFGPIAHNLLEDSTFQPFVPYFRIFLLLTIIIISLPFIIKKPWVNNLQKGFMLLILIFLIIISVQQVLFFDLRHWMKTT